MSYNGMLKQRCLLLESKTTFVDGVSQTQWTPLRAQPFKCFLDLSFIRKGKDPMWTIEAGRPNDRTGVLFLSTEAPATLSGLRVRMVKGPSGEFLIEGAVDEIWRPASKHHFEVGVKEVPKQLVKGGKA